jgi:hypothetical protein
MANVDSNTNPMKGQILFCETKQNKNKNKTKTKTKQKQKEKHSDFAKKLTDNINMIEFLNDSRHAYGCNLLSYCRRLVPFCVRNRFHTEVSQEKRKGDSPIR